MNIYRIITDECPTWFTEAENKVQALMNILGEALADPTGSDFEELSRRNTLIFEIELYEENTTIEAYEQLHPGFHDE